MLLPYVNIFHSGTHRIKDAVYQLTQHMQMRCQDGGRVKSGCGLGQKMNFFWEDLGGGGARSGRGTLPVLVPKFNTSRASGILPEPSFAWAQIKNSLKKHGKMFQHP